MLGVSPLFCLMGSQLLAEVVIELSRGFLWYLFIFHQSFTAKRQSDVKGRLVLAVLSSLEEIFMLI